MPFKSEAQRRAMHANAPEVAKKWEKKYGPSKNSMYAKAIRSGSQSQSPHGKKTSTGGSIG